MTLRPGREIWLFRALSAEWRKKILMLYPRETTGGVIALALERLSDPRDKCPSAIPK
jgi:hypothetical protein